MSRKKAWTHVLPGVREWEQLSTPRSEKVRGLCCFQLPFCSGNASGEQASLNALCSSELGLMWGRGGVTEKGQREKNLLSKGADALCSPCLGHKRTNHPESGIPIVEAVTISFWTRKPRPKRTTRKRNIMQALSCVFITATDATIS